MSDLPPDYHAKLMRDLDEPTRDFLIFQGELEGKVVDARDHFERRSLNGKLLTMPFPWFDPEDIA